MGCNNRKTIATDREHISIQEELGILLRLTMAGKKLDLLKLNNPPEWITQENLELTQKPDFQRIVRFFVINTPDKKTCARGKEISEYGYDEEDKLFRQLIGSITSLTKGNLEIADIQSVDMLNFPPSILDEKICFKTNKEGKEKKGKEVTDMFKHIRNSLAHGRFNIGKRSSVPYLIMEDMTKTENCSARIVLKFKTLIDWIDLLEGK